MKVNHQISARRAYAAISRLTYIRLLEVYYEETEQVVVVTLTHTAKNTYEVRYERFLIITNESGSSFRESIEGRLSSFEDINEAIDFGLEKAWEE